MMRERRETSGWFYLAGAMAAMAMFGALGGVTSRIGPAAIPIWFAALGSAAWVLRGPLGKAISERIAGRPQEEEGMLDVPEQVYAELDELRGRVAELEERVDFSERLLAQRSTEGAGQ